MQKQQETRLIETFNIIYEESDDFWLGSSQQSVRCWRPHPVYPGCPAEGQSLQRGQVWNMPVFSLMTHSTINTLQLSRSACGYGRVYWLLASVPLPDPVAPSWSSSRLELEALQSDTCTVQWSPAATQTEADTHSSTEEPMKHHKSRAQVLFSSSRDAVKSFVSLHPRFPQIKLYFPLTVNRD